MSNEGDPPTETQSEQHPAPEAPAAPEGRAEGSASFLRAARAGDLEKVLELLRAGTDINTSNANGLNSLHLASKEGHSEVVRELIKRQAQVDAATRKGNTALHIASLAGQSLIVTILVENHANVNVQSVNGFTPLYMAAQENHEDVVRYLINHGANQALSTEDGFTPLAVALQQGHDRVVAVLLENDAKGRVRLPALHIAAKKDDTRAATLLLQNEHNPDVTSKSGFTPLHIAAHYGHENVGQLLLEKGANVNYQARHNISPLHVATKWGRTNMANLLLSRGAIIDSRTKDLLTPLHCAARSGHDQVVDLLVVQGAPISAKTKNGLAPLHMAAQGDHVDAARTLLYHRAPVDDVTVDYLTPLHVAAHCGHVRVAKLLLDRSADPNARALNGFTPLHIACKKNRIKVVELLLKYRAAIEATTESGLTPLHVAAFMGAINIVIYLLQQGANPDVETVRGETPLHLAARANQTDVVRVLIRNGAKVDAQARELQTPLHIASRLGNTDIVVLLLQAGANSNATTRDNYSPLHIAAKEGQEEVAGILLDHNADKTLLTKKGFTPLHLASKYGNLEVVRLLLERGTPVDIEGKNQVTPLHVAAHYNNDRVAMLLLENGASAKAAAKNGYTPLHIAAKKNQIEIASTLLKFNADPNAKSRAGFTPLHLAAQEGHKEISGLLIENGSNVGAKANNGLTAMHLCAQEDHVPVAAILHDAGAEINSKTNAGYTPLHVACHFGQLNMVKFLVEHGADVGEKTRASYTPLHQAAQQGHNNCVRYLLENGASPNEQTATGQTPLSIAQRLGYVSVVETLRTVTETTVITETTTVSDERYKPQNPEAMNETMFSESEDEGQAAEHEAAAAHAKDFSDNLTQALQDSSGVHMIHTGDTSTALLHRSQELENGGAIPKVNSGEMSPDKEFAKIAPVATSSPIAQSHSQPLGMAPRAGSISRQFAQQPIHGHVDTGDNLEELVRRAQANPIHTANYENGVGILDHGGHADNVPIGHHVTQPSFLISFLVDARGGAMRGCRHSGVRIIVPPRKASQPIRVTCRYLRKDKLAHPPPLSEGEELASRILEMAPAGAKFLGPVILEVPHFASLRDREREIVILRSDDGQHWKEHQLEATEDAVQEVLNESFDAEDLAQLDDLHTPRITRILTNDFPMYFAVVTRVRQEVHCVGPEGGVIISSVVPRVQAIFPDGSLTKTIKVSVQAQPVPQEMVTRLHGNRVAVSPIVTVEPRRRKFHKPITLCIPLPQSSNKGMLTQYSGQQGQEPPTLRLLCSITGGSAPAQWEDITGTTQLTFTGDEVSFTTTVSARFWLMDCQTPRDAARMAQEVYNEAISIPYMAKFAVFARRTFPVEGQLRVFCMTDDKEDKTLEKQEHFKLIAKSRDVEVLKGKHQFLEFAGNLVPITKSGDQLSLFFLPFQENRLAFLVKTRNKDDSEAATEGRIGFMAEPKIRSDALPPQQPICTLAISLPEYAGEIKTTPAPKKDQKPFDQRYQGALDKELPEFVHQNVLKGIGADWPRLGRALEVPHRDIQHIRHNYPGQECKNTLKIWIHLKKDDANQENLDNALRQIGRDDIVRSIAYGEPEALINYSQADSPSVKREPIRHFEDVPSASLIKREVRTEDIVTREPIQVEEPSYSSPAHHSPVPEETEPEEEEVEAPVAEMRTVVRTERHVHDSEEGPVVEERTITTTYEDDVAVNENIVDRTVPLSDEERQKWEELNRLADESSPSPAQRTTIAESTSEPVPEDVEQSVESESHREDDGTIVTTTVTTSHISESDSQLGSPRRSESREVTEDRDEEASAAEQHAGQDSGTTQKRETAEEGFTNEDGSVVVSKKMTRVVTTTRTTLPGEGEEPSAPESPVESLGSVKDRIARFEQLKDFHPDPSASGAPSSLTSSQIQEESSEILPEEQEPEHPYIPEPDHSKVIEQVQVQVHVEDEEGEEVHVEDETAPVAPDRHHGLTESSIGIVITPHTPIPPEHPEEHLKDEDEPREPLEPSEPEQVAHAQLKDTREYSDEELAQELQPSEEQVSTAEIKDIKSYSPTSSEDERSSQKQPISPPIPQERHVVHPVASESTHEDEELAAHFVAESFEKQEDHHAENIEQEPVYRGHHSPGQTSPIVAEHPIAQEYAESVTSHDEGDNLSLKSGHDPEIAKHSVESVPEEDDETGRLGDFAKKAGMVAGAAAAAPVAIAAVGVKAAYDVFTKSDDGEKELKEDVPTEAAEAESFHVVSETTTTREYSGEPEGVCPEPESPLNYNEEKPETPEVSEQDRPHVIETTTTTTVTREIQNEPHQELSAVSPNVSSTHEEPAEIITTITREVVETVEGEEPEHRYIETTTTTFKKEEYDEPEQQQPHIVETSAITTIPREFRESAPAPESPAVSEYDTKEVSVSPSFSAPSPSLEHEHLITETTTTTSVTREFRQEPEAADSEDELAKEITTTTTVTREYQEEPEQDPQEHLIKETTTTTSVTREFHGDEQQESPAESVKDVLISASPALSSHAEPEQQVAESPVPSEKESQPDSQVVTETTTTTVTTREYFEDPAQESYSPVPSSRAESDRPTAVSPAISEMAHADVSQIQEQKVEISESPTDDGKTSPAPPSHVESERPVSQSPAISEKLQSEEPHFVTETVTTTTVTREYHEKEPEHHHDSPTQFQPHEQQPTSSPGSDDDSDGEGFGRKALGFAKKAGMAAGAVVAAPVALAAVGAKSAYDALTKSDDEEEEPKEHIIPETTTTSAWTSEYVEDKEDFDSAPAVQKVYQKPESPIEEGVPQVVETFTTTTVTREAEEPQQPDEPEHLYERSETAGESRAESEHSLPHVVETTTTTVVTRELHDDDFERSESPKGKEESEIASSVPSTHAETEHQITESPVPSERDIQPEGQVITETTTTTITTVTREFHEDDYERSESPKAKEDLTVVSPVPSSHAESDRQIPESPVVTETTTTTTTATRDFHDDELPESPIRSVKETSTAASPVPSEKESQPDEPIVTETTTTTVVTREFHDDDFERSESPKGKKKSEIASPVPSSHAESEHQITESPVPSEKDIQPESHYVTETTATTTTTLTREFHDGDYECPESPEAKEEPTVASPVPSSHAESDRQVLESPVSSEREIQPESHVVTETTTTTTTVSREFHDDERPESPTRSVKETSIAASPVPSDKESRPGSQIVTETTTTREYFEEQEPVRESYSPTPSSRAESERPVAESPAISERAHADVSQIQEQHEGRAASPIGYGKTSPAPSSHVESDRPVSQSPAISEKLQSAEPHFITETVTTTTVTREYHEEDSEHRHESPTQFQTYEQQPRSSSGSDDDSDCEGFGRKALGFAKKAGMAAGAVVAAPVALAAVGAKSAYDALTKSDDEEEEPKEREFQESTVTAFVEQRQEEPQHFEESERLYEESVEKEISSPHVVETTTTTVVSKEFHDEEHDCSESTTESFKEAAASPTPSAQVESDYPASPAVSEQEHPHVVETTTTTIETQEHPIDSKDRIMEEEPYHGEAESPTEFAQQPESPVPVPQEEDLVKETTTTTTVTREFYDEPTEALSTTGEVYNSPEHPEHHISELTETVTHEVPEDQDHHALADDSERHPHAIETTTTTTVTREFYEDEPEQSPAGTPAESEKSLPQVVETATTETREFYDDDYEHSESSAHEAVVAASPAPSSHIESERAGSPIVSEKEIPQIIETTTTTTTSREFYEAPEEPVPTEPEYHQKLEEEERDTKASPIELESPAEPSVSQVIETTTTTTTIGGEHEPYRFESSELTEQEGEESDGEGFGSKVLGFAKKAGMAAGAVVAAPVALAAVGAKSAYDALKKSDDEEETEEHNLGEPSERRDLEFPVASERNESPVPSEPSDRFEKESYGQEPVPESPVPSESSSQIEKVQEHPDGHHFTETTTTTTVTRKYFDDEEELAQEPSEKSYTSDQTHEHPTVPSPSITDQENVHHTETTTSTSITRDYREEDPRVEKQESEEDQHGPMESTTTFTRDVYEPAEGEEPAHHFVETTTTTTVRKEYSDDEEDREEAGVPEEEDPHVVETITTTRVTREYDDEEKPSDSEIPHVTETTTTTTVTREYYGEKPDDTESPDGSEEDQSVGDDKEVSSPTNESVTSVSHEVHEDEPHLVETITTTTVTREFHTEPEEAAEDSVELVKETVTTTTVTSEYPADPQVESPPSEKEDIEESTLSADREEEPKVIETTTTTTVTRDYYEDEPEYVTESERLSEQAHSPAVTPAESEKSLPHVVETTTTETREFHYQPEGSVKEESIPASPTPSSHVESEVLFDKEPSHHLVTETTTTTATTHGFFGEEPEVPAQRDYPLEEAEAGFPQQIERDSQPLPSETRSIYEEEFDTQYPQEQYHPESPVPTEQAPLLAEQPQQHGDSGEESEGEGFGSKMLGFAKKAGMAAGAVVAAPVALAAVGAKSAYDALRKSDDEEEPEEHFLGESREKRDIDSPVAKEVGHYESPVPSEPSTELEKHPYTQESVHEEVPSEFKPQEPEEPVHFTETSTAATTLSQKHFDEEEAPIETEFIPTVPEQHHREEESALSPVPSHKSEELKQFQDEQSSDSSEQDQELAQEQKPELDRQGSYSSGYSPKSPRSSPIEPELRQNVETTTTTVTTLSHETPEDAEKQDTLSQASSEIDIAKDTNTISEQFEPRETHQEEIQFEEFEPTPHSHDIAASPVLSEKSLEDQVASEELSEPAPSSHIESERAVSPSYLTETAPREDQPEHHVIDTTTTTIVTQEYHESPAASNISLASSSSHAHSTTDLDREIVSVDEPADSRASPSHVEPEYHQQSGSPIPSEKLVTRIEETFTTEEPSELQKQLEFPAGQYQQEQFHPESPEPTEQAPLLTEQQHHQELQGSEEDSDGEGFGSKMLGFAKKAGMAAGAVVAAPVALAAVGAKSAYDALRKSDDEEEPEEQEHLLGKSRESPVVQEIGHQDYEPVQESPAPSEQSYQFEKESVHLEGHHYTETTTRTTVTRDYFDDEQDKEQGSPSQSPSISEQDQKKEQEHPHHIESTTTTTVSRDYHDDSHQQISTEPPTEPSSFEEPAQTTTVTREVFETAKGEEPEHHYIETTTTTTITKEEYEEPEGHQDGQASPTHSEEPHIVETTTTVIREPYEEPEGFRPPSGSEADDEGHAPRYMETTTTTTVTREYEVSEDEEDYPQKEGSPVPSDSEQSVTHVVEKTTTTTVTQEKFEPEDYEQHDYPTETQKQLESPVPPEKEDHGFVKTTTTTVVTREHFEPEDVSSDCHGSPTLSEESERYDIDTATMTTVTQEHFEQPDSEELTSRSPTHYEREQTSPASQKSPITSTSSLHEHFEPEKEHYVVEKQELSSSSFEHHVTRVEETTTTTVSRELHEEEPEFPAGQCYQDQYHHESPVPTEQAPLLTEQQQHQELKESGDESEKEGFGSKMLGFAKKAGMAAGAVVAAPVALAAVGAKSAYDALRKSDDEEEPEEQERLFGESRERRDLESPVVSQQHYAPEPIHESSEFSSHFEGEEKSAQPTATFYEPEEEDRAGELEDHPATSEPKFITPTHSVEPEHQKPDNVEDPEYVIDSEDYQVATEEEPRISSPVHSDSDEVSHYQEEEHDTTRTPVVTERIDAPYVVESEEYAFERRDEPRIASPTQQDENEEDVIESAAYPRDEANFENLENRSTSESGGSPRPFEDSTTTTVISVHHEPPAIPEPEIDEEDALEQEGNSIIDSQDYDSHTTVTTVEAVEPVVQTDTSPTVVTTVSTEHLDTTHEHFDQEHFDPENEEETHDFVRTTTTTTSHEEPEEEQYVVDSQEYQRSGHESPVLSVKSEANDEDIERRRIETTTTTTVTKEYVEPEEHVVESQEYTSGSPVPSERSADHGIYHEHYQPEEPQEETEQKVSPGGDEEDEDVHGYIKTTTTTTTVTTEHTEPEEHVVESHEYTSGSPVPSERFADHGIYREHSQPEEPQEETEQKVSPGGDEEDEDVHGYIRTTTTTTTVTTEHAEPEEHVVESQEYTSGSPVPSERSVDHGIYREQYQPEELQGETEQKVSLGGEEDEDVHGYIRTTTTTTTVTTEHTEPEEHVVESREYTSGSPIPSERSVTHGFKRADSREHYEPEEHQVENEHSHSPTDREEEDVHGYIKTTTTTTVTKEHTEPEEHVVESHEYTSTSPVLSEHSVTRGVERTDSREHYEPEERQVEGEHKLSPSGEEEEDVHGYIKTTTTTTVTKEQFEPEEHLVESQEYTSASPVPSEGSVLQAVEPVTRELKKDEEEDVHGFIKTTTTTTVTKEHVEPEEEHHVVESHEYTSGSPIPSEGSISRLVETLTTTTVTCENFDREEEHESPAPTEQAPLLTEQQQPHELEDSGDESEKEGFGSKMFGFAKKAGMAAGAVVAAPVALAAIGAKSAYDALRKSDDEEEPERQEHLLGESREKRDLDSPVASAQDEPIHYQTTDLQEPEKRIESHETHDSESEGSFVDHGEQNQGLPLQSKEAAFDLSREDIAEQTAEKLVSEVFQPLDRTLIESEQYRSSIESLNRPSPIPAEHKKSSHDDLTSEAFQNVTKLSYGDAETYDHDHDHDSKDDVDEKEEWKVYDRHGEVLEEFSTQLTEDVIHEAEDDATYHLTRQEEEQKQSTEISPRRSTFLKQESCQEISNEPEVDYYSDLQEKLNILAGEKSNLGAHVEEELPSTASDQLDVIHESDNEQQEHQEQLEQEKEEEAENTAMELVNQVLEQVVTELSEGEDEDQKTMTSDAYLTAASEGEGKDDQYDTCVTSQDDTYESAQGWTSQDSEYTTATSQAPSRLSDSDGEHTARDRDLERQETSTPQAMLSPVDSDRQFTVQQDYDVQVPALPSIRAFEPEDFMQSTARSTPDVALQVTIEEEDESDDKLPISPSGVLLPPTSDPGRPVSPVPPRRAATEQDGGVFVFVREEDTIVEPTPPPDVGVTAQKEDVQETERIHGVAMEASSDPANSESSRYSRQLSDLSSSAESHADTVIRVEGERSGSSDSLEVISVISGDKEKSPETVHEPVVETGVEQKTSTPTIPEDPIVHQTLPTEAEQLGFEIYDADTEEPPQVPIEELETVEEEPEDSDSLNEGNGSGHSSVGVPADTLAMIGKYRHQSSDNLSLTSLQEFERLEKEVGARGDGSLTRSEIELLMAGRLNKSGEGSVSSLAEFERLEKEITENQSPTDDVMMLSDIREESEAEDMSIRDDDEEEVIGSDTELHSRPVQEEDLRAATPVAPSPTDSLEHQVDPMQFQYLETSTDSLEPTFQEIEVEQRADSAEDTSLAEYEMVPRVMETSTTDSLDGGIAPTEKDSLLEGASQGIESTQSTHGMLSGDTVGNVVTDDEDKDSLDGEVSSMLQSYPTTLTTFQTTVVGPDGTVQTISRRVETRVTDPLVSHVTFTGTESQERLDQLPHEEQFETVDTEGNVTRTTFRREQEHHY